MRLIRVRVVFDQNQALLSPNKKWSKCTIVKCTSHNIRLGKGSQFDAFCLLNVKVFVDSSIQPFLHFFRMIFDFARIQMNMYLPIWCPLADEHFAPQIILLPDTLYSSAHFTPQHTLHFSTLWSSAHFNHRSTLLPGTFFSLEHLKPWNTLLPAAWNTLIEVF
jgi:hypothetical protein